MLPGIGSHPCASQSSEVLTGIHFVYLSVQPSRDGSPVKPHSQLMSTAGWTPSAPTCNMLDRLVGFRLNAPNVSHRMVAPWLSDTSICPFYSNRVNGRLDPLQGTKVLAREIL